MEFYGSEDVWDAAPTESALRTAAVVQLGALRAVFESLKGWQNLVPDFDGSFITAGRGKKAGESSGEYTGGDTYVTGALTPDGTLAVIYLPAATTQTITLNTDLLGPNYTARWVDPTTGASISTASGSRYTKTGANGAGCADWLLVLESSTPR